MTSFLKSNGDYGGMAQVILVSVPVPLVLIGTLFGLYLDFIGTLLGQGLWGRGYSGLTITTRQLVYICFTVQFYCREESSTGNESCDRGGWTRPPDQGNEIFLLFRHIRNIVSLN